MSLVKGTQEFRTILDFSKGKVSKNMIKNALRDAEVLEIVKHEDGTAQFITNVIKIGMYQLHLNFHSLYDGDKTKLKDYGGFRITVYENSRNGSIHNIRPCKDKRFKTQYWVNMNREYVLRMNNLVDIIYYTKRLDSLKMFL